MFHRVVTFHHECCFSQLAQQTYFYLSGQPKHYIQWNTILHKIHSSTERSQWKKSNRKITASTTFAITPKESFRTPDLHTPTLAVKLVVYYTRVHSVSTIWNNCAITTRNNNAITLHHGLWTTDCAPTTAICIQPHIKHPYEPNLNPISVSFISLASDHTTIIRYMTKKGWL